MFSWQLRSKGLRPRRWLRTNKQHKRLLLANQEPNVFPFPPLYLQLNPLGHKVTAPAKDNNQHEVIISDSAIYPEVLGKWKPAFLSPSDPISRAGQAHHLLPILSLCSASYEHSPRDATFSQMPASSCFQMAAGFLTSSPISLSPLGFLSNVILSHLVFSSWMMCRSFLQRLPTCSSCGLSDLPAAEMFPSSEGHWCSAVPQLPSRGEDHFAEVCRLLFPLSSSASLNSLFPP